MNKYVYAECPTDYWPEIHSISAHSIADAVERLIEQYTNEFEDDNIAKLNDFDSLRDYLNETYNLALSDLEDYEEL